MALKDVKTVAVPMELDKTRHLVFDLNAFAELEDKYGSMEKVFAAMQTGSMKAARTLLWAGLLHEDETLTEKQVGSMVAMDNLQTIMDAISTALLDAMPEDTAAPAPEDAPADPT